MCSDTVTGQESAWFARDYRRVYTRRCQACHGELPHPNDHAAIWDGRLAWINFSNPHLSPALTAHLSREAGGRGIAASQDGPAELLFPTTDDPDYQIMFQAIEEGKRLMLANPRADMPGFTHPGNGRLP